MAIVISPKKAKFKNMHLKNQKLRKKITKINRVFRKYIKFRILMRKNKSKKKKVIFNKYKTIFKIKIKVIKLKIRIILLKNKKKIFNNNLNR